MRISFLVHDVYGIGGTVRTVVNLASELSRRHRVEIVSVLRRRDRPTLAIPSGISVVGLLDQRAGGSDRIDPRARELSGYVPAGEQFHRFYSRLSDDRIAEYLRGTRADVVIGTRPALNLCVARLARPDTIRIAQEHGGLASINASFKAEMRRHYPRLSAVATLTAAATKHARAILPDPALPIVAIPNSVPAPDVAPQDASSKVVIAAGRLATVKRYELLVSAFAKVVAERPDWRLRIYGAGGQLEPLAALVKALDLHNHVFLMGPYAPLETEWVKGSVAAVTSAKESFGMTIVEAMRCGLPVVSTDCPVGPAEIIADGVDGLLVPTGDVDAIAGGLLRLINDDALRAEMGRAALRNSQRYDPGPVAARYEELFDQLSTRSRLHRTTDVLSATLRGWGGRGRRAARRVVPRKSSTAHCRMTANQVLVEVAGPAMAELVLKARGDTARRLRLPARRSGHRWTASFPADAPLVDEGRWDLFRADARGALFRLRAGRVDVRGLVGAGAQTRPFARNVPYRTADGFLAVAAWQRPLHAEVDDLWFGSETLTVTGRLIAATFGRRAPRLRLIRRGDLPGELSVEGRSTGDGGFAFDVPLRTFAALRLRRQENWDAEVGCDDIGTAPLARLMDDVVERKKTYVYPAVHVPEEPAPGTFEESPPAEVWIKPYYTRQSGLAFVVTDR